MMMIIIIIKTIIVIIIIIQALRGAVVLQYNIFGTENKEGPNRLKSFFFVKLNCCSTPTFTLINRQPEGSFPRSQELIMNHNKRECKDAVGTGVHAHFPQVFIPPLYFSVATGFACFVTATEFELEYIYSYSYVVFRISRRNAMQRHTERHAQNVRVSKRHTARR
jgi:hypothetical protein